MSGEKRPVEEVEASVVPDAKRQKECDGNENDASYGTFLASLKSVLESGREQKDSVVEVARELRSTSERTLYALMQSTDSAPMVSFKSISTNGISSNGLNVDWKASYTIESVDAAAAKLIDLFPSLEGTWPRHSEAVSGALASAFAAKCFGYFLREGKLLNRNGSGNLDDPFFSAITDTEYIMGCINFAHELQRFAILQATDGRTAPVVASKEIVGGILAELLRFDFRNGPLRRKYDSLKYVHKRLQDIMYELSLSSTHDVAGATADASGAMVVTAEFQAMCDTMTAYDEQREHVIKKSRAIAKSSKSAIFCLHRGEVEKARSKLKEAATHASAIYDEYVAPQPLLRPGTYANGLEEYVEGYLFESWLQAVASSAPGARIRLATSDDVARDIVNASSGPSRAFVLTPEEYLGGLYDLTGEIGRYAIAKATERDSVKVKQALNTVYEVQAIVASLGSSLPHKLRKKSNALTGTAKKLEHVLYELALVKGTGRSTVVAATTEEAPGDD